MPFRTVEKPQILRTQLTEDTHKQIKALAAKLNTSMAKLVEQAIIELLERQG